MVETLLGSIAHTGLSWLSRQRLPQIRGTLNLPGISASVEIFRDTWGIPHIYAKTLPDAFFAQGFVHAQDRLWQMELNRRTGQGTLSEVFGKIALDTDRTIRTFGFNRLGQADWANATSEERQVLQAYTDGVNAFLSHPKSKLPLEFTLLGFRPAPWKPEDTASFARVMIWQLSHAWYGEIVRAQIAQAVGPEHAAELEISYPAINPIVLPKGIEFNRIDPDGGLLKTNGPFLRRGKGSNAWAISAAKSVTGHPILCNDMHLALSLPSVWYEIHLDAGEMQVTGVSLPGVPAVLVGHNAAIAWGMTLAFTDCEDLFVEQFDPQTPGRYYYKGDWLQAETIPEKIRVKGQAEPHVELVLITRHGPVISDVVGYPAQQVAVQSMSLRPCPALYGWLRLNLAQGWDDFVEAMRLIEAPQLNVAYADVENNIGYWITGKVPVRLKGDGSVPAPGWTGEYEWTGEVPFEEMPHLLNPQQGYLVHTNNRIVADDYPHFLGNVWMNGYRARRLVDLIESKEKHSLDDCCRMQNDFVCLPGKEFVAALNGFSSQDPDIQTALLILQEWDGRLTTDSRGGIVYEVARYTMVRNLLEACLDKELALRLMGQGFHPLLLASHEFYGHDTIMLLRLLKDPDSWWIQQAGGRETLISRSLKQTVDWLRKELGPNSSDWKWGKLHHISFVHPLSAQKPLDEVFNLGPFPIGGDTDTPCQTAISPDRPYDNTSWAPSFRQVVDLGDLSRSIAVFSPGQSGQLGSPHYADLIEPWLKGEYHPMLWKRSQVEQQANSKLILTPQH